MKTIVRFLVLGIVLAVLFFFRLPDLLVGAWIDAGRKANGKELA